ncbi:MAG: LLM class flavin-dependent oxidoreductase [Pseudomonadota bacterium]
MHLGTTPWSFRALDADRLAAQAERAEALGFDSFWLPENHFSDDPAAAANRSALPDPLMLLAACAVRTERLRLGTTSYLLTLRNPIQAAEQVAVLDQLSNGRVTLGVGRGFAPPMLAAYGVVTREKRRIFERCLLSMQALWRGESLAAALPPDWFEDLGGGNADAVRAELANQFLAPLPVQRPHPPIWVAAFGPKALAQAGRLGLPYLASPMESLAQLEDNWQRHRDAGAAAGTTPPQAVPIMRTVLVTGDAALARNLKAALAATTASRSATPPAPVDEWALIGPAAEIRDRLARYRERLGVTHLIATRLRVEGVDPSIYEASLAALSDLSS